MISNEKGGLQRTATILRDMIRFFQYFWTAGLLSHRRELLLFAFLYPQSIPLIIVHSISSYDTMAFVGNVSLEATSEIDGLSEWAATAVQGLRAAGADILTTDLLKKVKTSGCSCA